MLGKDRFAASRLVPCLRRRAVGAAAVKHHVVSADVVPEPPGDAVDQARAGRCSRLAD